MLLVALRVIFDWRGRRAPPSPRRILIAHHLLFGDTLMLTPLLAKLRERYPRAEVVITTPKAFVRLYQHCPYGVRALAYDPRDIRTLFALWRVRGFDLALLPADNRYSWLARALGARWIVAFAGDRPAYKNWLVDDLIPYSTTPTAWGDTTTELIPGAPPSQYRPDAWRAPDCAPFSLPDRPYCVLHLGASSPLKHWSSENWRRLADWLRDEGCSIVWSAGPGETELVSAVDPEGSDLSLAGCLDLTQLWHLLASARLLVVPDTGIAHLGRVVNVPTVTLFGPGSASLCGAGDFWRESPYRAVTIDPFPCRDQRIQYLRTVDWIRRCERFPGPPPARCPEAKCMQAIDLEQVIEAVVSLWERPGRARDEALRDRLH